MPRFRNDDLDLAGAAKPRNGTTPFRARRRAGSHHPRHAHRHAIDAVSLRHPAGGDHALPQLRPHRVAGDSRRHDSCTGDRPASSRLDISRPARPADTRRTRPATRRSIRRRSARGRRRIPPQRNRNASRGASRAGRRSGIPASCARPRMRTAPCAPVA